VSSASKLHSKSSVLKFQSNMTRDSLAKALYCRTVATIVRRANSLKRLGSTLGTLSSDSNESVHNQAEVSADLL
jgi:dachs protein